MSDQQENTEQRQEEIASPQTANEPPQNKTCILTKILCGCIVGLVVVFFAGILLYNIFDFPGGFDDVIGVLLSVILFASPFLAIASLIRISLNPDRLRGRLICTLLLAFSCFLIFQVCYMMVPAARMHGMSRRVICSTNLKGLGTALMVYANDYDDYLPSDNWCDRMIEEVDVSPRSLQCPFGDSEEGESDYCLNIHAAGKKLSELPSDMVLLFEYHFVPAANQNREPIKNRKNFSNLEIMSDIFTGEEEVYVDRWNRVGGPELLAYDRHDGGCNILFADGHTAFVKTPELTNLKWDAEGTVRFTPEMITAGSMPQYEQKQPFVLTQTTILLAILGSVCVAATLYVLIRYKIAPYFSFVLVIAVLSAGTGMFFGNMSEDAYLSVFRDGTTGLYSGGFFGLLVGICFPVLLANTPDRIKTLKTFKGFAASVGMITGVICSTLVHLALIIVNKETNFAGILIGIPYGVFAGAVLGFISGFMLKRIYKPELVEPNAHEGAIE